MPELSLSRVRQPDHDLLVRLEAYDREAFGPTGLRTYDLAVMAQAGAVFVASLGDEVVGGCQLMRVLDEPSFFYVVGLYVIPSRRGRGLGRKLLDRVAEECGLLDGRGLLLTVSPDNAPALRLYKTAGFIEEAFVADFYGEGEDRFILRWRFGEEGLQRGVS